jgi:predicted metal-dependent peptidase
MSTSATDKKGFDPSSFYRDTPKSGTPAAELLSSARLTLLRKYPFYGKIAMSMVLIPSNEVATTAVDHKGRMFYNPRWVNNFTFEDAVFEFAHEATHLVQRLFGRRGHRNMQIFNVAADFCADTQLVDSGLKQSFCSKLVIGDKEFELVHNLKLVEPVYDHLLQKAKENTDCPACKQALEDLAKLSGNEDAEDSKARAKAEKGEGEGDGDAEAKGDGEGQGDGDGHGHGAGDKEGNGCGGGKPSPKHTCGTVRKCCAGTSADVEKASPAELQKAIQNVIAAKMYAEGKGNMPGFLSEQIDELTKSKVRWQDHIRTAANRVFSRGRYTYKRPHKRGQALGIRLQAQQPESRSAVVCVDTSGSMGSEQIVQCISETAAIILAAGCDKVWLILHDSAIYYSGYVGKEDLTKIKMSRGGTSHLPVFECLTRKHATREFNLPTSEHCELAVMFTDLGTDFPAEHPSFPVIWGVPVPSLPGMDAEVPFGKKIAVEL